MKVLYVTTVPSPYKVDFFNELGKFCILDVIFERKCASYRNSDWISEKYDSFTAIFLKGVIIKDNMLSRGIVPIIKKGKYDYIIFGCYSTIPQMIAQQYCITHKIKFIHSSDGGMVKHENKIIYRIKRYFISNAYAWLSTGKITNKYLEYYGAQEKNIYVYPFTSISEDDILNANLFSHIEKEILKKEMGLTEQKIILTVGRFSYQEGYGKGYDTILKAAQRFDESVGIYIVGDDPTDEFIRWKKEKKLEHVHYVGYKCKKELSRYYAAADLFVLLTRYDVWGLVINEAMTFGLPIITTNKCVAGTELVKNGENGFLIEAGDYKSFYQKAVYILNNPYILQSYGEKSFNLIKNYSIENSALCHKDAFLKWGGGKAKNKENNC